MEILLNSASLCNSAARISHFFLCVFRCFFLQAALQYFAILHLLHMFILSSLPSLPHAAHVVILLAVLVDVTHTSSFAIDRSSICAVSCLADISSPFLSTALGIILSELLVDDDILLGLLINVEIRL